MPRQARTRPSRRLLLAASAMLLALPIASMATTASAAPPEPSPVPVTWEFDFREGPLRLVTVDVPGVGPRAYFYLTFTITNFWGGELLYAPEFQMKTEEGDVLTSGQNVPPQVTEYILNLLNNPLIDDQIQILGPVLEGVENAKSGVVIWPANDLDVDEIMVFAANLSGEHTIFWTKDPKTHERKRIVLRKTLMLRYDTPGEIAGRGARPLDLVEKRWIMR
ncbi:MAG: hypothetical protein R3B57_02095 [Phycisphaerales bacterium]